jgi:hypothetical protein
VDGDERTVLGAHREQDGTTVGEQHGMHVIEFAPRRIDHRDGFP